MPRLLTLLFPLLTLVGSDSALLWDLQAMTRLRDQIRAGSTSQAAAVERLAREAERSRGQPLDAVTDKVGAGVLRDGEDPHDYRSVSIYFWPDPANPNGPWIKKDGNANRAEMARWDNPRLTRAMTRIRDGALAWWFTGREAYADDARAQLRRWFLEAETRMNPNLDGAQFIPGRNNQKGNAHGIIDSRVFVEMLSAVRLLEAGGILPAEDQAGMRAWFTAYLDWLTTSENGRKEGAATNNHGIYYDLQVAAYAIYIGDDQRAQAVLGKTGPNRLSTQIAADGSLPEELARPIAATYWCFTVEALGQIVSLERNAKLGTNLWDWHDDAGRSLRAVLHWVSPYVCEGKPWTYGVSSDKMHADRVGKILRVLNAAGIDGGYPEIVQRSSIAKDDRFRLTFPGGI